MQSVTRPHETRGLAHVPQSQRDRSGQIETPGDHDPGVDLHAGLESDAQVRPGGREPAELELGHRDVGERERHPPFVAEVAAEDAAPTAELDGLLPVADLKRDVAEVVQRDRAVPAVADPLG